MRDSREPTHAPHRPSRSGRFALLGLLLLAAIGIAVYLARGGGDKATTGTDEYLATVAAFNVGVAAILIDQYDHATEALETAGELSPEEPAIWANLGLIDLRVGEHDRAAGLLQKAATLAPANADIQILLGLLESRRGASDAAISHLRRAVEIDPDHVRARYALAQELDRSAAPGAAESAVEEIDAILEQDTANVAAMMEKARLAAKASDPAALRTVVERLGTVNASWPQQAVERLENLDAALAAADMRRASTEVVFLRNVLLAVPAFRADLARIAVSPDLVGQPLERFLVLPQPTSRLAARDDGLRYESQDPVAGTWRTAAVTVIEPEGPVETFVAGRGEIRRLGEDTGVTLSADPIALAPLDWNYDFNTDVAVATADGLRLFEWRAGELVDISDAASLDPAIARGRLGGVWPVDADLDGDLDLAVAPERGALVTLRNNGDGTFERLESFADYGDIRAFVWIDLDRDGDPDVALLDANGRLRLVANERAGQYREWRNLEPPADVLGIAGGDLDNDGRFDIVTITREGRVVTVTAGADGESWDLRDVVSWETGPGEASPGEVRLLVADLDNNGGVDLLVSTASASGIWLVDDEGSFAALGADVPSGIVAVADLSDDGVLDLVSLSGDRIARAHGRATRDYRWQRLRPRAQRADGDQRINSMALGGLVQVRAGLLVQQQPIGPLPVHFGLGDHDQVDVARIVWPNGVFQAEFELAADRVITADQRLKGSCPWLFAFDGERIVFVTDFIWRSPLGLRINGEDTAGVTQTEDWVKIDGTQLRPRDGQYDIRVTAELWETHFFDYVALLVVDHPADTEVLVDERFSARTPPALRVNVTSPLRPVAGAWDDEGRDVSDLVRAVDERYLGGFGRGPYQGITRDHYVEVDVGPAGSGDGPLWLVADGWIYPTDSSINVAISQGSQSAPRGLSVAVADGRGGWRQVHEDLGYPAGKTKTVLVDLSEAFVPGAPRRLRLATNLEVYWDALRLADGRDPSLASTRRLLPAAATIGSRGFSRTTVAGPFAPEIPVYEDVVGTSQRWRDLVGYYTRFGDIRELVAEIDDRYAIVNAGDELRFGFDAPEEPPPGFVRDFVLIGDGWIKDGDFNTAFSRTVLPLPSHADGEYRTPPGPLEADPVVRRHPDDWARYHTRFVGDDAFVDPLRLGATDAARSSDAAVDRSPEGG